MIKKIIILVFLFSCFFCFADGVFCTSSKCTGNHTIHHDADHHGYHWINNCDQPDNPSHWHVYHGCPGSGVDCGYSVCDCCSRECPNLDDCVLDTCLICTEDYCKTHESDKHMKTCTACEDYYCGTHDCKLNCPDRADCGDPETCTVCGEKWDCSVHADKSGHNQRCSTCGNRYCGTHTCECPSSDCVWTICAICGGSYCSKHAKGAHCDPVDPVDPEDPDPDDPDDPDDPKKHGCGVSKCPAGCTAAHCDGCGKCQSCGPVCDHGEKHGCGTDACPAGCTAPHCPEDNYCQVHGPICVHNKVENCPNHVDCKIKYCKVCGGKLCLGKDGHLPSSHDHEDGEDGEDEEYNSPIEKSEFEFPKLKFLDIVEDRLFPDIDNNIPDKVVTVIVFDSGGFLPDWANLAITNSLYTVRNFVLTPEFDEIASWCRLLSKFLMSVVFAVAVFKFINK